MSKKVGSLVIDIKADTAKIITDIDRLSRKMDSTMESIGRSADKASAALEEIKTPLQSIAASAATAQAALAAIGVGLSSSQIIEYADSWKLLETRIGLATELSSQAVAKHQLEVVKMAQELRLPLNELGSAYYKMASIIKEMGGTQNQAGKVTETFVRALKIGGATTQEAAASLLQFSQALASGRLNGDEFRSLAENAPYFMRQLSKQLGITQGDLKNLSSEGKLTSDLIVNAVFTMADRVAKDAKKIPVTIADSLTMMDNAARKWVGTADEASGSSAKVSAAIAGIANNFDSFADGMIVSAAAVAAVLAGKLGSAIQGRLAESAALRASLLENARADIAAANAAQMRAQAIERSAALAKAAALAEAELAAAKLATTKADQLAALQELNRTKREATLFAANGSREDQKRAAQNAAAALKQYQEATDSTARATQNLKDKESTLTSARTAHTEATKAAQKATDTLGRATDSLASKTSLAAAASRGFGTVIGALGGPVGVAITALTLLAFNWDKVKDASISAADAAQQSANRITAALKRSDFAAANASLGAIEQQKRTAEDWVKRLDQSLANADPTLGVTKQLQQNRAHWLAIAEDARKQYLEMTKVIETGKQEQADAALGRIPPAADAREYRLGLASFAATKVGLDRSRENARQEAAEWAKNNKTKQEQRKEELEQHKAHLDAQVITLEEYHRRRKITEDKFKETEKKGKKPPASGLTSQQSELANIRARIEAEQEQARVIAAAANSRHLSLEKLNEGEKLALQYAQKAKDATHAKGKAHWEAMKAAAEELATIQRGNTSRQEALKLESEFAETAKKRAAELALLNEEAQKEWEWLGLSGIERAKAQAAWEEEKAIRQDLLELQQKMVEAVGEESKALVQREIDRTNADAVARKAAASSRAASKYVAEEWARTSQDIERALTDSLMRGFDNGKGFADSLKDHVKNAFKSMVVRILVQPIMGAINSVGGQLYGQIMGGQPQQGQQQGGGSLNNLLSGFTSNSTGQTLSSMATSAGRLFGYNTAPLAAETASMFVDGSQAIYGFTDAAATAAQSMGVLEGSISSIATNASAIPNWGYGLAGIGGGLAGGFIGDKVFGGKGYANTGGSLGGSAGASLALAAGAGPLGITAAVIGGALLGGGLGSLFGDREPDMRKAKFGYGASDALREEGKTNGWTGSSEFGDFRTYSDQWFSGSEMGAAMSQYIDSLEALDKTVADSLSLTSSQTTKAIDALKGIDREYSFGLQWTDWTQSTARIDIAKDRYAAILDSVESGWGDFVRNFAGTFEQFPAYLSQITATMRDFRAGASRLRDVFGEQITSIKQFESAAKGGETSAATFQRLAGVFTATNLAADLMGQKSAEAFGVVGLASAEMREKLVQAAGGIDALTSKLQSYAQNYLLDFERNARQENDIRKQLADVGLALPTSRLEFRRLFESLDKTTESGRKAIAVMLSVESAFASLHPEITSAEIGAKGLAAAYEQQKKVVQDLLNDAKKWLELRTGAGNLLDSIDKDLGRASGDFAAKRMQELWSLLPKASLEQQIELAKELQGLITSRYQDEQTAIERVRDTAKSLREYVLGLRVGDLSPYTMGQRLAEAASQYTITLAQAQAGDPAAMANLQSKADAYLALAKDYYASNDDYVRIFESVTSSLDALGAEVLSGATSSEQAAQKQIQELQRLRDVVANAYTKIDAQYQQTSTQLQSEFQVLVTMATQLGKLNEISALLVGLPAELAAQLQPIFDAAKGNGGVGTGATGSSGTGVGSGGTQTSTAPKETWYATDYGKKWDSTNGAYATQGLNDSDLIITTPNKTAFTGEAARNWIQGQLAAGNDKAIFDKAIAEGISAYSLNKLMGWADGTAEGWAANRGLSWPSTITGTATSTTGTATSQPSDADIKHYISNQLSLGNPRAIYDAAAKFGISASYLDSVMGWAAGTANKWAVDNGLPQFAVGTNYLPQDMVAVVHEGERIIPKADNRRLFEMLESPTPAADVSATAELKAEIRELKAMMTELLSALLDVTHHSNAEAASKIVEAIERTGTQSDWERRNRPALT